MSEQEAAIRKNVESFHNATRSSRYSKKGLSYKKTKLSPKNFERLMAKRGLSPQQISELKLSALSKNGFKVRHAKSGEKFVTTHGTESSSGIFVSKKSLGKTPAERIDRGALPHSNSAEFETTVALTRDQNLVYSKIAPQRKFSKMDQKGLPRRGGGEQIITGGGYKSGAVVNRDTKYPAVLNSSSRSGDFKRSVEVKNTHTVRHNGKKASIKTR